MKQKNFKKKIQKKTRKQRRKDTQINKVLIAYLKVFEYLKIKRGNNN